MSHTTGQPTSTRCRCICPNGCDCGCTCPAATELRAEQKARRAAGGGPIRIQRRRTSGWRIEDRTTSPLGAAYVGRPTRFGNPFVVVPAASRRDGPLDMWAVKYRGRTLGRWDDKAAARAEATDRYARWIREPEQADTLALFHALLHGRDLTCWCPPPDDGQPDHCHAAVLLELVNQQVA